MKNNNTMTLKLIRLQSLKLKHNQITEVQFNERMHHILDMIDDLDLKAIKLAIRYGEESIGFNNGREKIIENFMLELKPYE